MRARLLSCVLLLAAGAAGCIDATTVISVKPDGSGTLEQRVLMNAQAFAGMFQLGGGAPAPSGQGSTPGFGIPGFGAPAAPDTSREDELKAAAARLGEGVRFVSSAPISGPNGFTGVAATYAFDDIGKLRIDQDPSMAGAPGGVQVQRREGKPLVFSFARKEGGTSVLTANFTDMANQATGRASEAAPQGGPSPVSPEMLGMAKAMFAGFRVGIVLQPAGEIVRTNAAWVDGRTVTLLEMDLGALLQDEAKLREIQTALGPNPSVTELKPYLVGLKGLKMNDPIVTVEFR